MHTVEDGSGRRYLLLKRSAETSLVRDLETGERRHLPNASLSTPTGVDTLAAAADAVPAAARARLPALDAPALGLLVLLGETALGVREVLERTDRCESDLLGLAGELRAAGLLEAIDGDDGYALTGEGRAAVETIQSALAPNSTESD